MFNVHIVFEDGTFRNFKFDNEADADDLAIRFVTNAPNVDYVNVEPVR